MKTKTKSSGRSTFSHVGIAISGHTHVVQRGTPQFSAARPDIRGPLTNIAIEAIKADPKS
jgi:hypothetical protein